MRSTYRTCSGRDDVETYTTPVRSSGWQIENRTPLPSSGGSGRRLKVHSSRFSEKNAEHFCKKKQRSPNTHGDLAGDDACRRFETCHATPARIRIAARIISRKFEAGPASDISAERRGYCIAHCGLWWCAGPADHPAPRQKRNDWDHHHPDGSAADMRRGIERDLASAIGGVVAEF